MLYVWEQFISYIFDFVCLEWIDKFPFENFKYLCFAYKMSCVEKDKYLFTEVGLAMVEHRLFAHAFLFSSSSTYRSMQTFVRSTFVFMLMPKWLSILEIWKNPSFFVCVLFGWIVMWFIEHYFTVERHCIGDREHVSFFPFSSCSLLSTDYEFVYVFPMFRQ